MPPLVSQGLDLAMYGMGTVFVFLTILVLATTLMSWMVAPTEEEMTTTPSATALPQASNRKLAAITAAIHLHRSKSN
jgi:oxaloacetate decarboxylase gamma subunit